MVLVCAAILPDALGFSSDDGALSVTTGLRSFTELSFTQGAVHTVLDCGHSISKGFVVELAVNFLVEALTRIADGKILDRRFGFPMSRPLWCSHASTSVDGHVGQSGRWRQLAIGAGR